MKCYWYLEADYAEQAGETIFPDGCIDLIFQLGYPLHVVINEQWIQQPTGLIIGPLKQPIILTSNGLTRVVGIRFFPYGAYPFIQLPLKEISDQTTALDSILGRIVNELAERLDVADPDEAFRELEQFLLQRLRLYTANIDPVQAAALLLYQQHGAVDVASLADYANMTERSLERKFGEIVGFPPKTLSRILRFNRVRNVLMINPQVTLTDLTYLYGYYDQAHFIHDFQRFAGYTPSSFADKVRRGEFAFHKKG